MTDTTHETSTYAARESWLSAAVEILRPRFAETGHPVPEKIRVAVGFGPTGARQESAKVMGVCLHTSCALDGVNEIWISPEAETTSYMLALLIHELAHAALNNEDGHTGRFAEIMTRLGMTGRMTEANPSLELEAELVTMAAALGEYPGARVDLAGAFDRLPVGPDGSPLVGGKPSSGPEKQGTRQLKVECRSPECDAAAEGYKLRMTRKHLDAFGAPICPGCGIQMDAA